MRSNWSVRGRGATGESGDMMMNARPLLFAVSSLGLSGPAMAQGIPEHPHFFGGEGMGMGAMMVFGPLFFLVFLAVAVAVVVLLIRWLGEGRSYAGHPPSSGRSPLDILRERFARGEIDKAEFDERRHVLGD